VRTAHFSDAAGEIIVRRAGDGDAPTALDLVGDEVYYAAGNPTDDRLHDMQDRQAHRARVSVARR